MTPAEKEKNGHSPKAMNRFREDKEKFLPIFREMHKKADKEKFGPKLDVIDDLCFALMHCDHFSKDTQKIRKKRGVPESLDPYLDMFWVRIPESRNARKMGSLWWKNRDIKEEAAFDRDIRKLIDSYEHIPMYLFWWVKYVAMYQKEVPWRPANDANLLIQLLKNPEDCSKLPLTTEEKINLRKITVNITRGERGKPIKGVRSLRQPVYALINQEQKNLFRGTATTKDRARKTLSLQEEYDSYHHFVTEDYEESSEDITYKEKTKKRTRHENRVDNARQMKKRLLERIAKLTKKKVKK